MSFKLSNVESRCELHPSEEFRFYCEDCEILICDDCITSNHKLHKNIKIKEYGAKMRGDLEKLTLLAETSKIPEMEKAVEKATQNSDLYRQSVQQEVLEIQSKRKMIDAIFDELEKELTDSLAESDQEATLAFEKFVKFQKEKVATIRATVEEVKTKGSNLSESEVAKYSIAFRTLLEKDPFTDSVPYPPKYKYIYNQEFSSKERLQNIIGFVQSDNYSTVYELPAIAARPQMELRAQTESPVATNQTNQQKIEEPTSTKMYELLAEENSSEMYESSNSAFSIISKFKSEIPISHILPKNKDRQAWIIGTQIFDIDCSSKNEASQTRILPLTNTVITACLAKNDKVLLGHKKQTNMSKVEPGTVCKLVGGFKVCSGKESLACICRSTISPTEHVACIEKATGFVLRRYSNGKSSCPDIPLTDIEHPIQICDDSESNVCTLCRPETNTSNSWIVVFDKKGDRKFRYPRNTDGNAIQNFVGFGFIGNKSIIVIDQISTKMKLINLDGMCLAEHPIDRNPVCCSTDKSNNIWVGFDNDQVKVLKYNTEHVYDEIRVPKYGSKDSETKL